MLVFAWEVTYHNIVHTVMLTVHDIAHLYQALFNQIYTWAANNVTTPFSICCSVIL